MTALPPADPTLIDELVAGNRILFHEKVVDGFGHISVRHDKDPARFLMSRSRAPGLVTAADLVTHDFDGNPLDHTDAPLYGERFIHGEIYRARPEVQSVVHCHAPQLIPFAATRTGLRPLYHMSGFLAEGVPIFEIREAAGQATNMLIRSSALGAALARSLADKPMVLMRGHGATMVGGSIRQAVYRAVYAALNAGLQMEAMRLGEPIYLDRDEGRLASQVNEGPGAIERVWQLWREEAMGR
jgi:HCOMODA/2-hydroxy-3-carboxy-muconic semialdehyde decarboxylase